MKVTNALLLMIVLATVTGCAGDHNAAGRDAADIYAFINQAICKGDGTVLNLESCSENWMIKEDAAIYMKDSLHFSQMDLAAFRRQLQSIDDFSWIQDSITCAKVIDCSEVAHIFRTEDGWEQFHTIYKGCITSYSMPIFNQDKSYCIIHFENQCDWLTGNGATDLYKKENGKWLKIRSYSYWLS